MIDSNPSHVSVGSHPRVAAGAYADRVIALQYKTQFTVSGLAALRRTWSSFSEERMLDFSNIFIRASLNNTLLYSEWIGFHTLNIDFSSQVWTKKN